MLEIFIYLSFFLGGGGGGMQDNKNLWLRGLAPQKLIGFDSFVYRLWMISFFS